MISSLINKKRTEGLLEQTRQNFETFFNTIDDFLWVLDIKGNIVHTNNTVISRLGYTREELVDRSVLMVHPVDRRNEANRIVGEMLAGKAEFCPVPVVTKSGKQIPVETRVKIGFWDSQPVIFGVSKDISQLQLSEQKFSKAFQSNSAMMAISNFENGAYIDVNNELLEIMGYEREDLIGSSDKDLNLFVDRNFRNEIIENLKQNLPIRKREIQMRTKDGTIKTGLLSADSIYIGKTRCLFTVTMDISNRKKAEEELVKARIEAEHANMAKSEFLSRMSHELRTPMNSILGFAQLLDMGELKPTQKKNVSQIIRSGKHLLDLINEVLDITRIEAGRMSLSLEPVQVNGIIQEMMDTYVPLAKDQDILITLVHSPDNLLHVKADRQRLRQILLNLISNAVKYNRLAGSVIIKAEKQAQNEVGIIPMRISFTDTGPGIAPEAIAKLFVPFERIGAERTKTQGSGLGLSVVKKLVNAMGGIVGVESEVGEGSTFWIELPVSDSPLDGVKNLGLLPSPVQASQTSGKVLYIEDNASNVELVQEILLLQRSQISLLFTTTGLNAVEIAIQHKPNLILLDLNLPDIHGSKVIKMLKKEQRTKSIPVVIISADATPQQVERLLLTGAERYLTKPLDVGEFLRVVDQVIKP
jgi:PAS domain S-box-containing protein